MLPPSEPLPGDSVSSYLRKLEHYAIEGQFNPSQQGNVSRGPGGSTISDKERYKYAGFCWRDTFDISKSYYVNDVVRVTASVSYGSIAPSLGTFLCVRCVPPATTPLDVNSSRPDIAAIAAALTRNPSTNYTPQNTEPTDTTILFWKRLGGGSDGYFTYNFNSVYSQGDWVRYTGSTQAFYHDTTMRWTYPGTWKCIKPIPASGSARTSSWFMPVWPEPTGSISGPPQFVKYWELIALYPIVDGVCQDGQAKDFLNNIQEFEPAISASVSRSLSLPAY